MRKAIFVHPFHAAFSTGVARSVSRAPKRFFCLGCAWLLTISVAAQATTINPPDTGAGGVLTVSSQCKGVTPGGTTLLNNGVLSPVDVAATWPTIWNDVKNQFSSNWTYTYTNVADLGGSINVVDYKALDSEDGASCTHYAILLLYYDGITAPTGQTLDWIQVYKKSGQAQDPPGYGKQTGWSFDPPKGVTSNGTTNDKAPYYYNKGDKHYEPGITINIDGKDTKVPDNQVFYDKPQQVHTEANAWEGDESFDLFLVSYPTPGANGSPDPYDPNIAHNITIYAGLTWGFVGECTVPVPSAVWMGLAGLLSMLVVRGLRRQHT